MKLTFTAGLILALTGCGGGLGSISAMPFDTSQPIRTAGAATPDMTNRFTPDTQIVMLGDSITAGGDWQEYFPAARITNRGISGDSTDDILERMDGVLSDGPEVTYLMVGINDVYNGASSDEIYANYVQIVDILQAAGSDVVLNSTLECSASACGAEKLATVRALNERLVALAAARGFDYIDMNAEFSGPSGLLAENTFDGVHMNGQAYMRWVGLIGDHMSSVGLRS
ncbi:GDSL-type esterase/lipase family protein [Pelagovum pacificum]|nr:GDSL-type esterase/lipase family protein [Pelagovum pacificum]QQA44626.1 hypothetical protein I8N54_08675 [Pelagovum pacificum]